MEGLFAFGRGSDARLSLRAFSFRRPGVLCLRVSDSRRVQAAGRRFYPSAKDAERTVVFSTSEIESLHAEREEYAAGHRFYFVGPSWVAYVSACRCADGTAAQDKCTERFSTLHGQS